MSTSFNRKCTLLTQYLKEKGGFGHLSLGLTIPASTPHPQGGVGSVVLPRTAPQVKSMDLFPQGVGFGSGEGHAPMSLLADNTGDGPQKAETAPMTIFYAGQVLVFNDFPADKAKEIMLLAGRSGTHRYPSSIPGMKGEAVKAFDNGIVLPIPRTPGTILACDLPIARRDSLLRFLEKRKDRITTRASPYPQVKGRGSKGW